MPSVGLKLKPMLQEGSGFHCNSIVWAFSCTAMLTANCCTDHFMSLGEFHCMDCQKGHRQVANRSFLTLLSFVSCKNIETKEPATIRMQHWLADQMWHFFLFCRDVVLSLTRDNAMAMIIAFGKETALLTWAVDGTQLIYPSDHLAKFQVFGPFILMGASFQEIGARWIWNWVNS